MKCQNREASVFGFDKPGVDQLVSVSIKIKSSQREKVRGINLSEFVREKLDESFP